MKGLYFAKAWFTARLNFILKIAVRKEISPDVFTWIGVLGACFATRALILSIWWLVGLGLVIRLGGANLDGAIARAQGKKDKFGFIVNEIGDRLSDFIIMIGLVKLAWMNIGLGQYAVVLSVVALLTSTFPTIISLSGAGAGGSRINGGPFGKTERCASIFLLSVAIALGISVVISIAVVSSLIIIGSIVTAVMRALTYKKMFLEETK